MEFSNQCESAACTIGGQTAPTNLSPGQLSKLEKYIKEMYQGIVPEIRNGHNEPIEQRFLDDMIGDPLDLDKHDFHKMRLEHLVIDEGYPIAWRDITGRVMFVQLRKIDKDKLLLGCGNNPTSICYHHPISLKFDEECFSSSSSNRIDKSDWWAKTIIAQTRSNLAMGINHLHEEYNTIDPDPVTNPTIVGFFGWYNIPTELIPDNSMKEICSEGIILDGMKNFTHDYERITGKRKTAPIREICFGFDKYDYYDEC